MVNSKPSLLPPSGSTCHIQAFHTVCRTGQSGTQQFCLVILSWSVTRGTATLVKVNIVKKLSPARPCSYDFVTFVECASFKSRDLFKVTAKLLLTWTEDQPEDIAIPALQYYSYLVAAVQLDILICLESVSVCVCDMSPWGGSKSKILYSHTLKRINRHTGPQVHLDGYIKGQC